jgi:4-amino-4-deoxy-L-arabinose transferase-like glycosyltransferase
MRRLRGASCAVTTRRDPEPIKETGALAKVYTLTTNEVLKPSSRRGLTVSQPHLVMVTAVLLVALAIRLAYICVRVYVGLPVAAVGNDSPAYIRGAEGLLAGLGLQRDGVPTAYRVPAYTLFVAAILFVGKSLAAVALVQVLLSAITAGITANMARRLVSPRAGWIAGLLVALNPHLVLWAPLIFTETVFVFLCVLALSILIEAQRQHDGRWFATVGLVLALGSLTRPVLLPAFIPFAAILTWWYSPRIIRLRHTFLLLLATCVLVPAWVLRNQIVVGAPLLAAESGYAIWIGYNPNTIANHQTGYAAGKWFVHPSEVGDVEHYRMHMEPALRYLREHPESIITAAPARLWNMLRPVFARSQLTTWVTMGAHYIAVTLLALAGLVLTARSASPGIRYLQVFLGMQVVFYAVTLAEIRFRMPLEPIFAIFAALALERGALYLRSRVAERQLE